MIMNLEEMQIMKSKSVVLWTKINGVIWHKMNSFIIYSEHYYNHKTANELCKKYCLSIITVKRIIKLFSLKIKRHEIYSKVRWRKLIQQPYIRSTIQNFINQQSAKFGARNVKRFVKSELKVEILVHQIRNYMKSS